MDLRVLLTTFGIIFLAEMGDKTQLAAMTMSAQTKKTVGCVSRRESRTRGCVGGRSFGWECDW